MRTSLVLGGLLASVLALPALAQSNTPAPSSRPATTTTAPATQVDAWRASKLKGLDVYNDNNEKLGDITEILIDKSGKVGGVVIGVGGFLGLGEHDIMVENGKLKFIDEPVRTSSTTTNTTGSANRPAATNSSGRKWYPDHAILPGATKESLKSLPQFKF